MGKRYRVVEEEEDNTAGGLALLVILGVIGIILAFAHIWLSLVLGFCGFWIAKTIVNSTPSSQQNHKTAIYLCTILGMGGLGYWGGKQISDNFNDYMETPPPSSQPAKPSNPPSEIKDNTSNNNQTLANPIDDVEPDATIKNSADNSDTTLSIQPTESSSTNIKDDCTIWREAHPQLAQNLEPGDRCY